MILLVVVGEMAGIAPRNAARGSVALDQRPRDGQRDRRGAPARVFPIAAWLLAVPLTSSSQCPPRVGGDERLDGAGRRQQGRAGLAVLVAAGILQPAEYLRAALTSSALFTRMPVVPVAVPSPILETSVPGSLQKSVVRIEGVAPSGRPARCRRPHSSCHPPRARW